MQRTLVFLILALSMNLVQSSVSNPVVLTISGQIAKTNSADRRNFEIKMRDLEQLENITITATTEHTGTAHFSGPRMRDILAKAGVKGTASEVIAIGMDGYRVRIPLTEFQLYDVIVATAQNGKMLNLETKGPLWIMYPIDQFPQKLNTMTTLNRLVWNLIRLDVN